ncbi:MAG TPA: aminotransferase class V-fold PLP-dependent enzyme [Vicinamibacterales bacterium]|nr:aminotransferase class V-fold PLP-dependent enzyme [Vicinamibacterales bacterium]
MPQKPIYLDYHATTPVDPRVLDAMLPYFTEKFGNAASRQHAYGWDAQKAVDVAREQVAALIGASAGEIVFTSGASESNNLAIKGTACALRARGRHLVTAVTEHKSVLDSFKRLEQDGCAVTWLRVDAEGFVDLEQLASSITSETVLVSVMAANNEIGTVQHLSRIGAIACERNVPFHTDAAQAAGKVPIDVAADHIDLLALTGHKYYGPKGAGALFVRRATPRLQLEPQIDGGGHESGFRSGTLNVPGIVGLGAAAEICRLEMADESVRMRTLRDRLLATLTRELRCVRVNGPLGERRLPHNLHINFDDVEGERLLMALGDLAVSTGSACSSGSQKASHVLEAIGAASRPGASIRFGLGRWTTEAEIDTAAARVVKVVRSLSTTHAGN